MKDLIADGCGCSINRVDVNDNDDDKCSPLHYAVLN